MLVRANRCRTGVCKPPLVEPLALDARIGEIDDGRRNAGGVSSSKRPRQKSWCCEGRREKQTFRLRELS